MQSTPKRAECEARKSEKGRNEENCCLAGLLDDVQVEKQIQERIPKNTRSSTAWCEQGIGPYHLKNTSVPKNSSGD